MRLFKNLFVVLYSKHVFNLTDYINTMRSIRFHNLVHSTNIIRLSHKGESNEVRFKLCSQV